MNNILKLIQTVCIFHSSKLGYGFCHFQAKEPPFDIKGEVIGPRIAIQAAPAYRGIISDSLLWVKPVHVDTVFCTTNWKDLRPFYIIKQSPDAADYEWFTICWAGVNNYSTSELLNKKQLSGVWALKNGLLYAYFQGEEKADTVLSC